ncbi:MAG: peptidoglycan bridge formation glycyltransferase FemA/FemB family protein [Parcubacteria group bacterium]|nr:peptidoglycan bridge formation glycyltransferase FemA/FemB family protein [Parcubacteria group bacterium]
MEVKEIRDNNTWEEFLRECTEKTFLHSWHWGEFQLEMREKVWRLGIYEGEKLLAVALAVYVKARRGTFLLVPHGPVIKNSKFQIPKSQILKTFLEKLKEIARQERVAFIRINPIWKRTRENQEVFRVLGFRRAPLQMHPEASWKLDIRSTEDDLFRNMRRTTRYLIRQAEKNSGIVIRKSTDLQDIEVFSRMHKRVSLRQHFIPFSIEYLKKEFEIFSQNNQILLLFGEYEGKIAAASLVIFWSGIGFYHHAASLPEFAKLSIPYLLQWEAIKEAKKRGCWQYDFWGYVDPKNRSSHPWAGPTLFKMGFGGEAHEYVHTQDLPLKSQYWITFMFETLRRMRRGL